MHDDRPEILLAGQEALTDAEPVVVRLPGQRHARANAGVNEQICALAMFSR